MLLSKLFDMVRNQPHARSLRVDFSDCPGSDDYGWIFYRRHCLNRAAVRTAFSWQYCTARVRADHAERAEVSPWQWCHYVPTASRPVNPLED